MDITNLLTGMPRMGPTSFTAIDGPAGQVREEAQFECLGHESFFGG